MLAFTAQAAMGFGGGILAIPLLSLFYPVRDAVTLYLLFQMLEIFFIIKIRLDISWVSIRRIIPLVMIFALIGSFSLLYLDEKILRIFLCLLIVTYLIKESFLKHTSSFQKKFKQIYFALAAFGGFLQGLMGAGGSVFLIYLNELNLSKAQFRATMLFLALVCNAVRILVSIQTGVLSKEICTTFFYCIPAVLLAFCSGSFIHERVSQAAFKNLIYFVLVISAGTLVIGIIN